MPAPQRTARIEDDIWDAAQARARTENASLAALMRAAVHRYATGDLTSQALPASQPAPPLTSQPQPASHPAALLQGDPSPGTACTAPGCWQRNTHRYGLHQIPLCPACAAALTGQTYRRDIPPAVTRAAS